ncbi:MAG: hypothetical protein ACOX8L_01510 [Candidatus Methanomethylophilaceae archaeon]|jgi:hypothetical protein
MSKVTEGPAGPLDIVKKMRGVVHCFYLDDKIINDVKNEEMTVRAAGGNIAVDNRGFNEALERQHVICIIKDPRFRPPPEATVVLMDSEGTLLGTEVFPFNAKQYDGKDNVIWLSDGFVLFPEVSGEGKETFVMPPVSFPELNESNGCKDVISCSPAPTCDLMIKDYYGYEDDPRLASILVAFNDA